MGMVPGVAAPGKRERHQNQYKKTDPLMAEHPCEHDLFSFRGYRIAPGCRQRAGAGQTGLANWGST